MDFIKNLKISDDAKEEQKPAKHSPAPIAVKEESLFDKISDAFHSDASSASPAPAAAHAPPKDENLFDKIGGALGHKQTPPPPPPTAAKPDGLFDRIGDALTGKQTPPPPPAPVKEENLFDKIGGALGHKKTPPPAPETDLLSKISNKITGKEEAPPPPQGVFDKINHALGGGAAGEAEEGKLDKAIDLFQEHVLKSGPQHNESAVEQLKDKHIADTLRSTLGLPEKDKKKN